jgi:hypothetical protein
MERRPDIDIRGSEVSLNVPRFKEWKGDFNEWTGSEEKEPLGIRAGEDQENSLIRPASSDEA